jgi:PAS domain S-box-containing protein
MILSLRTTSYTAALFIALILGFLLLLGSRQYRSQKHYENIIEQNEKIIFQFATIREHITESLLEDRHQHLSTITGEVESLNVNISNILQQHEIPDEYRLSFAGQVDFAGIILLLRSIGSGDMAQAKIRQLNQEIRILGERLMLFDRVIVNHVKRKLVGFQSFVIGLLAIVLFIVIYILLFWHRQIAVPLIDLVRQVSEVKTGKRSDISSLSRGGEVAELASSFRNLLLQKKQTSSEIARHNRLLDTVHKVSDVASTAQSRDAIFVESCKAVLTNDDYILSWIGIPGEENKLIPVISDASTTMSRQECEECMAALLTAAEKKGKNDGAYQSLQAKAPVVTRDILAGLPKGTFKHTPFAAGQVDCIALPLAYDQQIFGVMNIYSLAPHSFSEEEVELLKGMSRELVFAIFALEAKQSNQTLARLQAARKKVFENNTDLIIVYSENGTILEGNPAISEKLGMDPKDIVGSNVYKLLFPDNSPPHQFTEAYKDDSENLVIDLPNLGGEYLINISPLKYQSEDADSLLMIARDVSERKTHKSETIKASKLAAMGEISVGVANEINNLTNGLINYTQILSEEIEGAAGNKGYPIELLNNVIEESERISQIVQQLLFFNNKRGQTAESVQIEKIFSDSLALLKHQFKYDGIHVTVDFPRSTPPVKVNAQEMQHVFLNLLSNARYALNLRYTGEHPNKQLEIKGELLYENGQQWLRIFCTDMGVGIHPNILNKVFEPFFSTKPEGVGTGLGLSICRSLVEDNKGNLQIESVLDDHTTILLYMPVIH